MDFIILASSSGGLRIGAWNGLIWADIFPIYQVGEKYKIELKDDAKGTIVCAGMIVYKNTPEQYTALVSLEAWKKLQEYKKVWTKKMSRIPADSDHLILDRTSKVPITSKTVKGRMHKLLIK